MQASFTFVKHSLKSCDTLHVRRGNTVHSTTYDFLSTAEAACETNAQCTGVYDSKCDNWTPRGFKLCNSASLKTSTSGSCVFTKTLTTKAPTPVVWSVVSTGVASSRNVNYHNLTDPYLGTNWSQFTDVHGSVSFVPDPPTDPWTRIQSSYCPGHLLRVGQRAGAVNESAPTISFDEIAEAQAACLLAGDLCGGIYDQGCDGVGMLELCSPAPLVLSSVSCVYVFFLPSF